MFLEDIHTEYTIMVLLSFCVYCFASVYITRPHILFGIRVILNY